MLFVNIVSALVVAIVVWYAASRALAQLIFATEARDPRVAARTSWQATATALTFLVFVLSVAVWVGLAYLLERLSH